MEESNFIIRKIDDLGRIVIPRDKRKENGIAIKDKFEICTEDKEIILKRINNEEISNEQKITRSIDELGRIVLPKIIREDLGFNIGDEVKIFFMTNSTILIKAQGKDFDYE
ncbi:MAG: AbrB/MazE/SpoVT family DNA-binding domain-containing protein [Clostridia bacterium]|nr:AbrB/MazE/SpoVT family DNA-binding domain-containing protein [Clostridia bacterium]